MHWLLRSEGTANESHQEMGGRLLSALLLDATYAEILLACGRREEALARARTASEANIAAYTPGGLVRDIARTRATFETLRESREVDVEQPAAQAPPRQHAFFASHDAPLRGFSEPRSRLSHRR